MLVPAVFTVDRPVPDGEAVTVSCVAEIPSMLNGLREGDSSEHFARGAETQVFRPTTESPSSSIGLYPTLRTVRSAASVKVSATLVLLREAYGDC